jgi:outer membrane protein TolC
VLDPKQVACVALEHRPEVVQAALLADVTHLEIDAQGKSAHTYSKTFAATSDIHAKVVAATDMGTDYRPGALAPEMPVYLAGTKHARQCRAAALAERSLAVLDKTRNLVALEAEDACLKLNEYGNQVALLQRAAAASGKVSGDARRAYVNDMVSTEKMLSAQVVEATNKAALNESLHKYTLALAALQRASAGHLWDALPSIEGPIVEKLEKAPTAK